MWSRGCKILKLEMAQGTNHQGAIPALKTSNGKHDIVHTKNGPSKLITTSVLILEIMF